jgi:Ca2+-binding EF-hand superfamily protein
MRFMTKDGKLYAVYGNRSIELRWEYIFTPIMHTTPLHVFNLNSKMANEFIQQLIQEMGDGELSYEQFMDLLKQTRLKLKK